MLAAVSAIYSEHNFIFRFCFHQKSMTHRLTSDTRTWKSVESSGRRSGDIVASHVCAVADFRMPLFACLNRLANLLTCHRFERVGRV